MTASDDDSIHLYNTSAGEHMGHPLFSKKYGVSHIRFTHHKNSVVYASTKVGICIPRSCSGTKTPWRTAFVAKNTTPATFTACMKRQECQ